MNVLMWGTNRSTDEDVEFDIELDHPFINENHSLYKFIDGQLVKDTDIELARAKERKDEELNESCNKAILSGFYHMVNGIKYHFSYDMEAQGNFGDSRQILKDGVVESVEWTVSTDNGYERIDITKEDMDGLTLSVFAHKQENIKKYRGVLSPMVKEAKTIEEVNAITWDYKTGK